MDTLSIIFEAAIAVMLGALVVFRITEWMHEVKRGPAPAPQGLLHALQAAGGDGTAQLAQLVREVRALREELLKPGEPKPAILPWTGLLDPQQRSDAFEVIEKRQRAHPGLSMVEQVEFMSCALLTLLRKELMDSERERQSRDGGAASSQAGRRWASGQ